MQNSSKLSLDTGKGWFPENISDAILSTEGGVYMGVGSPLDLNLIKL